MEHTAYLLRYSYHTILYHTTLFHTISYHTTTRSALLCISSHRLDLHRLVSFSLVWFGSHFFATRPFLPFPFLPSSSLFYRILAQTASSSSSKHSVAYCNDLAQLIDWLTHRPTDRPACRAWRGDLLYRPDLTWMTWPTLPLSVALHYLTVLHYRTWCDLTLPDLTYTDLTWLDLTCPGMTWSLLSLNESRWCD